MTSTCGAQFGEQFRRGQPVGDDDVGAGQQPATAHGDQLGVARSPADERDVPLRVAGVVAGSSVPIAPLASASRIAVRTAAERRCSPPASTPTDRPS